MNTTTTRTTRNAGYSRRPVRFGQFVAVPACDGAYRPAGWKLYTDTASDSQFCGTYATLREVRCAARLAFAA